MIKSIRSDTLKIMAWVFMLVDHIAYGIIEKIYLRIPDYDLSMSVYNLTRLLRAVGRMAFPIFCYQLVKGFVYTSNRAKYLRNLFLFALISEIPFDLLDTGMIINFDSQNVTITLFLGGLLICTLDYVRGLDLFKESSGARKNRVLLSAVMVCLILVFAVLAYYAKSDYGAKGIFLVAIIYVLKDNDICLVTYGPILFMIAIFAIMYLTNGHNIYLTVKYCEYEIFAILAFPLMYFDNGIRTDKVWFKWTGYAFYPLHMLIIYLVAKAVGLA